MQFHKWEVCIGTCMRDYLSPAILYFLYRVLRELPIGVACRRPSEATIRIPLPLETEHFSHLPRKFKQTRLPLFIINRR